MIERFIFHVRHRMEHHLFLGGKYYFSDIQSAFEIGEHEGRLETSIQCTMAAETFNRFDHSIGRVGWLPVKIPFS